MSWITLTFMTLLALVGTFLLTAISAGSRRLIFSDQNAQTNPLGNIPIFSRLHGFFFGPLETDGSLFIVMCTGTLMRFCYVVSALLWTYVETTTWNPVLIILLLLTFFAALFLLGEFVPRVLTTRYPRSALQYCIVLAAPYLLLCYPVTAPCFAFVRSLFKKSISQYLAQPSGLSSEVMEIIQETEGTSGLDAHDAELLESVIHFRNRIAREIMVPRVDMFSLPGEMSIREAAHILETEGYSRTPVYRSTVDDIIGVLMYRDIQSKYLAFQETGDAKILDAPISNIIKKVLYTPETKRISALLQEFRKKQVHLAIVVDEYGGTEGIITIEDILEQIVGDISDEYDSDESWIVRESDGGYTVDARMPLLDVEEELGVKIPQEGDYDTVAGFIVHCAGAIPVKGFIIHRDTFELEVVSSDERSVEKVRIRPLQPKSE